ncbi:MAG: LicD family protein, partial [Lachnospiraceae bacterium]|nr:LicD family protein [Lachnospiraceae bacterium]
RIPERAVLSYLDRMIARAPKRSRMVRILMFPTPNRAYGYPKKYYLSAAPTVFEGHTFPGAKDARGYLSF